MARFKDVSVGQTWTAKVSGKVVRVWIGSDFGHDFELRHGKSVEVHRGWLGINLDTGRQVRILSARRLRELWHESRHAG